jgi:alpha-1,6-mannosyltransferase
MVKADANQGDSQRMMRRVAREGTGPWLAIAAGLGMLAALLILFRGRFGGERELIEYPARWLAAGLVAAGLLFLALIPLIRRDEALKGRRLRQRLGLVVLVGLALRVSLLWSTPALEDDYYRYLWDGGVVASGHSPFKHAPTEAGEDGMAPDTLKKLATAAGVVHSRINHPDLRTIYPPVAEAFFALARWAEPWSLLAWRLVCLGGELATLGLLLALLRDLQRSPLWVAVYWWNPLAIKELINSAHMEAILMPFVLAALLLAVRKRPLWATGALAMAAGAKIWPVILAPLIWRQLLALPKLLAAAAAILGLACVAWALPPLLAGLGDDSGFVAYATHWKTASAIMPNLERTVALLLSPFKAEAQPVSRIARLLAGLVLAGLIVWIARKPIAGSQDLIDRALLTVAALYLLSPSQFPWYLMWLQPLLCLRPERGWLLASALVPLYYVSFYFYATDRAWIFRDVIVWVIWLPIWAVLINDALGRRSNHKGISAAAELRRLYDRRIKP